MAASMPTPYMWIPRSQDTRADRFLLTPGRKRAREPVFLPFQYLLFGWKRMGMGAAIDGNVNNTRKILKMRDPLFSRNFIEVFLPDTHSPVSRRNNDIILIRLPVPSCPAFNDSQLICNLHQNRFSRLKMIGNRSVFQSAPLSVNRSS